MKITCLAFAEAKELLGFSSIEVEVSTTDTPRIILEKLNSSVLSRCEIWRVALDMEFVKWDDPIEKCSELAIIPPVSGG